MLCARCLSSGPFLDKIASLRGVRLNTTQPAEYEVVAKNRNAGRMQGRSPGILMTTFDHYITRTQDEAAPMVDDVTTNGKPKKYRNIKSVLLFSWFYFHCYINQILVR